MTEKFLNWFYGWAIKVGIIKIDHYPERQGDMMIMVIEPRWFWQRKKG